MTMSPEGIRPDRTQETTSLDRQEALRDNPIFLILIMTALPLVIGAMAHLFP